MSINDYACIALGVLLNSLTFFLGVAVGVNICGRKDSDNGNRYEDEGFTYYADDSKADATGSAGGSQQGNGGGEVAETGAAKRPHR